MDSGLGSTSLGQTFTQPFASLDRVRRTLKRLQAVGQVQAWRYAVVWDSGGAAPLYDKLTLDGYRTLHQDADAVPPTKRYLSELSVARHQHQRHLTNYIVQTHVAHGSAIAIRECGHVRGRCQHTGTSQSRDAGHRLSPLRRDPAATPPPP